MHRFRQSALALLASLSSTAYGDVLLLGDSYDYEPKASDTYVRADAGACCIGEYHSLTNHYVGQSFIATGKVPHSLTLGLANGEPGDVPPSTPKFRLLITELPASGFQPGKVLWEGGPYDIPASQRGYAEYSFNIRGVVLVPGQRYAWVLDTYSDRDGVQDVLNFYWNTGSGVTAPIYSNGQAWFQSASGQGRAADFAYPWWYAGGASMSFLLRHRGNAPGN